MARRASGLPAYVFVPSYYRLGYQQAAQQLNADRAAVPKRSVATEQEGRPQRASVGALDTAVQFIGDARSVLELYEGIESRYGRRRWWRRGGLDQPERRLQLFLDATVVPCLTLVVASAAVRLGRVKSAEAEVEELRVRMRRRELSYRACYNLACYEATLAASTAGPERDASAALEPALSALRRALLDAPDRQRREELARWARTDPALAPLRERPAFTRLLAQYTALKEPPTDSPAQLKRPPGPSAPRA